MDIFFEELVHDYFSLRWTMMQQRVFFGTLIVIIIVYYYSFWVKITICENNILFFSIQNLFFTIKMYNSNELYIHQRINYIFFFQLWFIGESFCASIDSWESFGASTFGRSNAIDFWTFYTGTDSDFVAIIFWPLRLALRAWNLSNGDSISYVSEINLHRLNFSFIQISDKK